MKKTTIPKSQTRPLAWLQVERWLAQLDRNGSTRGVDRRLLTLAPAFVGILHVATFYSELPAAQRATLLRIAKQALNTASPSDRLNHLVIGRTLVMCDWMLRCALPLWLDRLPAWWSRGRENPARLLRSLTPLMWTQTIVDGVSALTPIWVTLESSVAQDRGTAQELAVVNAVRRQATHAMMVSTQALAHHQKPSYTHDEWICGLAMWLLLDDTRKEHDAMVAKTLPALVDALLAVQSGDSRQSIADRCAWPMPLKQQAVA